MKTREEYLSELLIILGAGLASILFTTLLAWTGMRIYESFEDKMSKKISKDVEKTSQESWETNES